MTKKWWMNVLAAVAVIVAMPGCVHAVAAMPMQESLQPVPDNELERMDQSTYVVPPIVQIYCMDLHDDINALVDEMNGEIDENWPWPVGSNQTWNAMLILWNQYEATYYASGCNLMYGPFPELPSGTGG